MSAQHTPGRRIVSIADPRSPMVRLLQDGLLPDGLVAVQYDQQWPTLTKARCLGYVDEDNYITDAGLAAIAKATGSAS